MKILHTNYYANLKKTTKRNVVSKFIAGCLLIAIMCNMFGSIPSVFAAQETQLSGEIEVIFNRSESEMLPYIEAFEEKYPNVHVKYTEYSDLESALKLRMEEGDYGDVMYFPSYISTEEADKYFEPLGSYETLSEKYNYINMGRYYDNVVYGIPSSAYFVGIIYNKEVFDKAGIAEIPTTIDEFLYAMYLINEHTDAIPFYAGYAEPWVLANWEVFPFIEMTGKASYKYNEFITDINPFRAGTVHNQTLKLLYDLVKNGYTEVGREDLGWWDSIIKLNQGEVGCSVIGTWALSDYRKVGDGADNIAFMPFPNNIDGKQYVTVTADYSYAIAKNSDNKPAARAFVEFMLDESGYAFEQDTISVLKTDPYPECYGDMTQTIVQNISNATSEAYDLYTTLTQNLQLYNQSEYVRIVEAAAGINDETFDDIMNDWNNRWEESRNKSSVTFLTQDSEFENTIVEVENNQVEFSQSEQSFIQHNPLLTVGYHRNLAPLSYEENGIFEGIARDICEIITEKSGITLQFKGYDNTKQLINAIENGEIDFIAGIDKTEDDYDIRYSKEYLEYMDVLVRHNTVNAASLEKYSSVTSEKNAVLDDTYKNVKSKTVSEGISNVEHLTTDFIVTNYYSANYYIRKNQYNDLTIIPYANNQTYHMGFSDKTDPVLIAIVNKCIYSISEGEIEIKLMEYMDEVVMNFTLMTFLKANPLAGIVVITVIFLMLFTILYVRYRSKNKQALEAKKYTQLAALADECFFEYSYKNEKMEIDTRFWESVGVDTTDIDFKTSDSAQNMYTQLMEQIKTALEDKQDAQFTIVLNKENGGKQWYRVVTSVVLNQNKQPVHMLGKIINIQKEMEEVTNYQNKAHRDSLTKLFNREGLAANLPQEATGVMLAVIDMDNFKKVNDTLGHDGGDYALMYFADKLEQYMGEKSLVARYGGDEFVVFLTEASESEAKERLEGLVNAMDVDLRYAGNTHKVSVSAGAVYSASMNSFEDMFHEADKILYRAKNEGKNSCIFEKFD